jgi:hypothetical protein
MVPMSSVHPMVQGSTNSHLEMGLGHEPVLQMKRNKGLEYILSIWVDDKNASRRFNGRTEGV